MNEKMNDHVCVEKRAKITPPNYSKENFMGTFTPQTQLTPEQVFCSKEINAKKADDLKARTLPLPVLPPATMYPPNTPVHLDFEKICKKRITPTGITKEERGFEQTKRRYLTKVIPFFNLLKEHFDGVQKSHVTEVRAMKIVFENLEAEVDQNAIDLKSGEIKRNENLIANSIAHDVFIVQLIIVETLREIIEEAKVERPLDRSLASSCLYTKHSQELLEYVIGTCPKDFNQRDKKHAAIPVIRKKQVTFVDPCETSTNNTLTRVKQQTMHQTNEPMIPSTGVNGATAFSGSKPRSNTKKYMTLPAKSDMQKVEVHPRNNKSSVKQKNCVDSRINYKRTVKQVWQTTGKLFATVGLQWRPTGRKFTLGEQCPLTRKTTPKVFPVKQWKPIGRLDRPLVFRLRLLKTYDWRSLTAQEFQEKVYRDCYGLWGLCSCDNVIYKVYYVEGLGYNLFSIGQFCDSDLKVAFRKHTCFVKDLDGVNLIKGSRASNLYTISVKDMMRSSPSCLLSKASKNKSWLWHRRLNHLNFGTINDLARKDLVIGLPRARPNPALAIPYVPPTKKELEILFQSMFDEYFEPLSVDQQVPHAPAVRILVNLPCPSVSISVDQDAPSEGHSPSSSNHQSSSVHHGVASDHSLEVTPFVPADNEPFVNIFSLDMSSEVSSSGETSIADSNQSTQPHEHL
nr:hypothetical protein [Tanacetum cinerariifolium]